MPRLNYHHLYYFWRVATQGSLTQAAASLHVSQSALSTQIRQLEDAMEARLFERRERKLVLTESGRRVLSYAEDIFTKGEELESMLRLGVEPKSQYVRIGVLSTMSRNFIEAFIAPLLRDPQVRFDVHARGLNDLLEGLAKHQYDVVLSNTSVYKTEGPDWRCQLLARQPVSIVGPPAGRARRRFPHSYQQATWVLPAAGTELRSAFDAYCALSDCEPEVHAESNDMAMLRLLARDTGALTVLPKVVVRDELRQGTLTVYMNLPNVYENFYGITIKRHYSPPVLAELLSRHIPLTRWQ